MKIDKTSRRAFLQGTGGLLLALPFMRSCLPRSVQASAPQQPLRFVAIKSYSTQRIRQFYPTLAGAGYQTRSFDGTTILSQPLAESSGFSSNSGHRSFEFRGHQAALSDFGAQGVSSILDARFNPFLSKMLLLRGLDFVPQTNHNVGGMLGNFAASTEADPSIAPVPTIDQVLASSHKFYEHTPLGARSLHFTTVHNANTFSFAGGPGGVQQIQGHQDPLTAFNQVFGVSQAGASGDAKLVDRVYQDYSAIRQHQRLSAEDRQRLERHMSFLGELETRLRSTAPLCQAPEAPTSVSTSGLSVTDLEQAYRLFVDVAVAAMICDLTRIVTIDVSKAVGPGVAAGGGDLAFTHSGLQDPTDWHETAHAFGDPVAEARITAINRWIAGDIFLRLIERLDVDEDSGRTFLDNALVMWGNELGFGHRNWSVPTVLAGSAGGFLKTGRYIDYINWDYPPGPRFSEEDGAVLEGVPYNRLLNTVLQAFGLGPADYESEPGGGYGFHQPTGKTVGQHAIDYDWSKIGQLLPDIRA